MTPLEEAVARIIDPSVFDGSIYTKHGIQFSEATVNLFRSDAMAKARAILALPEIVKMQEALSAFSAAFEPWRAWHTKYKDHDEVLSDMFAEVSVNDLFVASEALAALQPLTKEAE